MQTLATPAYRAKAKRASDAMLKMVKFDIAALQAAYEGAVQAGHREANSYTDAAPPGVRCNSDQPQL